MTTLAEITGKIQEVQMKRDALLKSMENLKTKSLKGKIDSMEYLKIFDTQSENLRSFQKELRILEQKKQKYEIFEKIELFMKENYLLDEEVQEIIKKGLSIKIPSETQSWEEYLPQITPTGLTRLLELLEKHAEQLDEEEITKRKEAHESEVETHFPVEEDLELDDTFKLEEILKPETSVQKQPGQSTPEFSSKESLLEKFKEIDDVEPYILDRMRDRKALPPNKRLPVKDVSQLYELPTRFQLKNEYLGFKESILDTDVHPNLIHLFIMDSLEDLGYNVEEHVFPLPEIIEVEGSKSLLYNFLGSIKGTIRCERTSTLKGFTSIHVREEGIASISYRAEKNPLIDLKNKIIFAGLVKKMNEEDLTSDLNVLEEKINQEFKKSD